MPQAKANPICRTTPVLTFAADYRSSHRVKRTLFLLTTGLLFAACTFAAKPPNVVLIISDDQSWTDYGFMEHEAIETPNIDRLARQSRLFKRGYVPTSLCCPSLATLITGLYPHQHGITGNEPPIPSGGKNTDQYRSQVQECVGFIDTVPTLPRLLAKRGYVSHQSGKWWQGHYSRGGFTHGMTHGDPKRRGRHGDVGLKIGREGLQPIFDFIDDAGDKPFFVWYAPFLPHNPHNPPKRLLDKYTKKTESIFIARYWAMCEWFDETCGQLLNHLDEKKLAREHRRYLRHRQRLDTARRQRPLRPPLQALPIRRRHPHADHDPLARQSAAGGTARVGQQHRPRPDHPQGVRPRADRHHAGHRPARRHGLGQAQIHPRRLLPPQCRRHPQTKRQPHPPLAHQQQLETHPPPQNQHQRHRTCTT